jgi:subtilisin family serine protease
MKAASSGGSSTRVLPEERVDLQLEVRGDISEIREEIGRYAELEPLDVGAELWTAQIPLSASGILLKSPEIIRIHTKKRSMPTLDKVVASIGLRPQGQARSVAETGRGVLIGIIDTGFDLSHPMFRDANGRLRVRALLDQTIPASYDRAQLETGWANGSGPGMDQHGHGTHVASIAGGSPFGFFEGIAPECEFLLVKTNFRDTDKAVSWTVRQAGNTPCVINLSLGHHFGPHDGSSPEERLHRRLSGPGKIIVAAAGNEREEKIHLGSVFRSGQVEEVSFSIGQGQGRDPAAILTAWYDDRDVFEAAVTTPWGNVLPVPKVGRSTRYDGSLASVELAHRPYVWSRATQIQIDIAFKNSAIRPRDLRGWRLRLQCVGAKNGRLDAWFSNDGFGMFGDHPLVEKARTVGEPATGDGCVAVASFVGDNAWDADSGREVDQRVVPGRLSPFSSCGPTRDNRSKPDIAAPGQYVTAALAEGSELARWRERSSVGGRLLTIEGTSMAAPVATGAIALMLQKNGGLDVDRIRTIFEQSASRDSVTGSHSWTPDFGSGKLALVAALGLV